MITGFQLDFNNKPVPSGVRIVLTLLSSGEEPYTFAIQATGVRQNYLPKPSSPKPNSDDEIWVEPTPASTHHRFIIHTPENQKILLGDFPVRISFEIFVERKVDNEWATTNKVLIIFDKTDHLIFQAREFNLNNEIPEPVISKESVPENANLENLDQITFTESDVLPNGKMAVELNPVQEVGSDELPNNDAQSIIETLAQSESVESLTDLKPQSRPSTKWRKRVGHLVKSFVATGLIAFAVFASTPLSLVPVDQPENERLKLAITLPVAEPKIGDRIVTSLIDGEGNSYNYLGMVENKSKNTYLLSNDENFVQIDENQINGRIVVTIPYVGIIFKLIQL